MKTLIQVQPSEPQNVESAENSFVARIKRQGGKIGYVLAWLIGVPIPILVLVYLFRGH